jgi:ubiquinone/menaquinone biosynthesis C-methylase UbiE
VKVLNNEYILNVGCGGREGDNYIWYGDVRLDIVKFDNVTHVGDAHDLPFEDKMFDRVVCYVSLEHFISPFTALCEMVRVLKDDGEIEIVVPNLYHYNRINSNYRKRIDLYNKADKTKLPDHKQSWDIIEIRNLMKQLGLILVSVDYLNWIEKFVPRHKLKYRILNYILPDLFTKTEVLYVLCRE